MNQNSIVSINKTVENCSIRLQTTSIRSVTHIKHSLFDQYKYSSSDENCLFNTYSALMDDIKIEPIIPLRLKRRIDRLISIDDILNEVPSEPDVPLDVNNSSSLDSKIYVEPRLNPKPLHEIKTNWFEKYCSSEPKKRVIWDSKLYSEWKEFDKKSKIEQVEDLMDASAKGFAECINELTDDEQHKISKEMIKKLFSIEIESDVAQALYMQKVQRPVVSKKLAAIFNCPELCIEENIQRIVSEDNRIFKVKPKYHAFGRSLSPSSKREKAVKFSEPEPFQFPEDIRSGQNLFQGIENLKCTKRLMNYLEENNMPKPKYLVTVKAKSNENSNHIPLYSFYQSNK